MKVNLQALNLKCNFIICLMILVDFSDTSYFKVVIVSSKLKYNTMFVEYSKQHRAFEAHLRIYLFFSLHFIVSVIHIMNSTWFSATEPQFVMCHVRELCLITPQVMSLYVNYNPQLFCTNCCNAFHFNSTFMTAINLHK